MHKLKPEAKWSFQWVWKWPLIKCNFLHDQSPRESRHSKDISQYTKGNIYQVDHQYLVKLKKKLKEFPWKSETRKGCPLSLLLFNVELEILATKQVKEIRGRKIEKKSHYYSQTIWFYTKRPDKNPQNW